MKTPPSRPAHYRLGIALQSAHAPDSAILAFKASVAANPSLVQAQTLEAQTLNTFINFLPPIPAISDARSIYPTAESTTAHGLQARAIWASILARRATPDNEDDRREAFVGLCNNGFDVVEPLVPGTQTSDPENPDTTAPPPFTNKFYLNYFFCSRAEAMFLTAQTSDQPARDSNHSRAAALSGIANALTLHDFSDSFFIVPVNEQRPH